MKRSLNHRGWLALMLVLLAGRPLLADDPRDVRREIRFPDLPEYQTLACDLHAHTVFSDGQVWPPVRVAEAWRQGLDGIALTDHVGHYSHKDDVRTDLNRPHELSQGAARVANLLLVKGAEITHDTPPGHFNAVFLKDAGVLAKENVLEQIEEANRQGAVVFWNHPGWQGEEKGRWGEVQATAYEKKWLHGIEICNNQTYYLQAHRWAMEKNLTMVGNSDIHEPELRRENLPGDHRTMTLVFAKERTVPALKEALLAGRTAVWYQDKLIGRKEWLQPLLERCLSIRPPHLRGKDHVYLEIENVSDVDVQLERIGKVGPERMILPARAVSLVRLGGSDPSKPLELSYTATNFWMEPEKGTPLTLNIAGEEAKP